MFTGIVEGTGVVTSIKRMGKGINLSLKPFPGFESHIGDSVSVNGVCLTVVKAGEDVVFNISPETLRNTNLGDLKINERVNLERAMRMGDRFGGHIVTGHVDGVGVLIERKVEGEYTHYRFGVSDQILRYTVTKGSVAVDGISLTVTGLDNGSFSVAIIPHTLRVTNIGERKRGDRVNIEVDIIGKYIERFMRGREKDEDLMSLLIERGFVEKGLQERSLQAEDAREEIQI